MRVWLVLVPVSAVLGALQAAGLGDVLGVIAGVLVAVEVAVGLWVVGEDVWGRYVGEPAARRELARREAAARAARRGIEEPAQ